MLLPLGRSPRAPLGSVSARQGVGKAQLRKRAQV
jgi:hypothetical protein